MTDVASRTVRAPRQSFTQWVRSKDPELLAIKRSVRAAVVMPLTFGIAQLFFTNGQVSLFAAFGSFALLLLVDFQGRPRTRLISYLVLFAVACGFIALGTAASTHKVPAVVAMAVIGFLVLFAGIVTPQAATAATAALLTFVLPVAVAQPASAIGPRLVGWLLAGVIAIPACLLVWPPPWHDNLRRRLSAATLAVARVADAYGHGRDDRAAHDDMTAEVVQLRTQFSSTPYPPTGAAAGAVALSKLVGRVEWVARNVTLMRSSTVALEPQVRELLDVVAETLRSAAAAVCDSGGRPVDDAGLLDALRASAQRLEAMIGVELETDMTKILETDVALTPPGGDDPGDFASVLDPGFHVRALGIATEILADAALAAAGADTVVDHTLGTADTTPRTFSHRVLSHLSFRSVWFRNSVRGAAGLALAVAVVEVTDVAHGFWVVLGTLSVLRSNALGTGATALRAVGGTAVGFVIGSAIMIGVSDHTVLLWVLLPVAVLISGVAPSMISFAAGQAGFTLVVIILFNIIEPTGWKVGLTRIEDVAIGCAVSVVVGLLFWPRGATAAFGRALSAAFIANSGYLADAVDHLTMTTRHVDTRPGLRLSHSTYLLLDDAFRQYFAERGAKVVSVETVSRLFTGANRIRLAAYTLAQMPGALLSDGQLEADSIAVAGAVLRDSYASSHRWYEEFAEMLAGRRASLDEPPAHDHVLHDVLQSAFDDARAERRVDRLSLTLRMLWADQLLENQAEVQTDLRSSADLFVRQGRRASMI
ncbi:MAG TPA: FUSC family protein [Acidimicrobiales bacterium]|nr:FUSC family protein [Acidimicrobiales bacterium]